ncbi:hypothetical protein [Sulfuricystis multivorans]|uniref:hypothetical protein n=1 Tax=Sulfuricystis multivorans TaxID=2211108 RepID=UPI000F82325A|nr:hypothetical protein [Sulfuricystis multivorans]
MSMRKDHFIALHGGFRAAGGIFAPRSSPIDTVMETLKKAASGMQRKAFGAQRPRKRAEGEVSVQANRSEAQVMPEPHNMELGEGETTKLRRRLTSALPRLSEAAEANTAQRGDAPAQQLIQRFLIGSSRGAQTCSPSPLKPARVPMDNLG